MGREARTRRVVQGIVISAGAVLLLAAALTLLAGDFVREQLIRPLLFLAQTMGIYVKAIPQLLIWFLLLLLFSLVSTRLVRGTRQRPRRGIKAGERSRGLGPRRGPIRDLARRIEQAAEGEYFKWRVRRELQDYLVELLAWRRGISGEDGRRLVRSGAWTADRRIGEFFCRGAPQRYTFVIRPRGLFGWLLRGRGGGFEQELSSVLDYLESFARGQEQ